MKEDDHRPINKIIVASVICELAALEIIDGTRRDLKERVKRLCAAARSIESYFVNHVHATSKRKEFKAEFLKGDMVLISEIFSLLIQMDEAELELILESINTKS